jgi:DNA mismatch repair protein MSH3
LLKRPSPGPSSDISSKKRRVVTDDDEDADISASVAAPSNQEQKPSDRTAKYIFSSSQPEEIVENCDPKSQKEKKALHQKFVQKLGKPDSLAEIRRRNHVITEDDTAEAVDEDDEQEVVEEEVLKKKKPGGARANGKLTPMERQYLELKRNHLDKVILYQVGYKYQFYGEDARIAAKELSIVCIPGKYRFDEHPSEAHLHRFASASIPILRLHVHVKRLVTAGHKVGVVEQIETAAVKAAGDNRNTPFTRELTHVYTQGTYVDEVDTFDGSDSSLSGYLLCLTEMRLRPGDDEKVRFGMVAVQPTIGSILYDEFEDGFMRGELETRLLHTSPCEYIMVGELSSATQKLIKHVANSRRSIGVTKARVETVDEILPAEAVSEVSNFYAEQIKQSKNQDDHSQVLDQIHELPELVNVCLAILIKHLAQFGLEHVFDLTSNFVSFSMRTHMLLNSNTLTSLEIYQSSDDDPDKYSLFWIMDRTKTRFGKRLLRSWVGRPLLDKPKLEQRLEAVEEVKDNPNLAADLKHILTLAKGDLEKALVRIYYKRSSPQQALAFLQSMQRVASARLPKVKSKVLQDALDLVPKVLDVVVGFLNRVRHQKPGEEDKYSFFKEEFENDFIRDQKMGIAAVEQDLQDYKVEAAKEVSRGKVEYVCVAGIDYLIEIENNKHSLSKVPASWIKVSNTKRCSRFHAPKVVKFIRERDLYRERLWNYCNQAFTAYLREISTEYEVLRDCIQSLAVIDCICSLADIASDPDYCKPTFTEDNTISISKGRHPMVEQLLHFPYVPNDINLSANSTEEIPSALLITGPNMGGKSSYVRSIALIAIMAQIGSYVPASSASLPLMDAVFTRMGAQDNMLRGESTFMVELGETADILRQATSRSLVILDELGRGTSTHDGVAIAEAVLRDLVSRRVMTMFITHYQDLAKINMRGLKNVHVKFWEDGEEVRFLYEVGEGVAHRSYG